MMSGDSGVPSSFLDEVWLRMYGPVLPSNALDYFSRSPYYDQGRSNNEWIRTRRLGEEKLVHLRGIEYRVLETQHKNLLVVIKQFRCSRTIVRKLAAYYILDNRIFPLPRVHDLFLSRISNCSSHLFRAIRYLAAIHFQLPTPSSSALPSSSSPSTVSNLSQQNTSQNASQNRLAADSSKEVEKAELIGDMKTNRLNKKVGRIKIPGDAGVRKKKAYRMQRLERQGEHEIRKILQSIVTEFTPAASSDEGNEVLMEQSHGTVSVVKNQMNNASPMMMSNDTPALLNSPLLAPTITPKTSPPLND